MAKTPDTRDLQALDEKIRAAQAVRAPKPRQESKYEKASLAWRMVIELVVGMIMGMGIGFGLDSLFGTLPIFLILFSLLGFAAGIRVMMRTATELQQQKAPAGDGEAMNETADPAKD